jgi:hypothetical protein
MNLVSLWLISARPLIVASDWRLNFNTEIIEYPSALQRVRHGDEPLAFDRRFLDVGENGAELARVIVP